MRWREARSTSSKPIPEARSTMSRVALKMAALSPCRRARSRLAASSSNCAMRLRSFAVSALHHAYLFLPSLGVGWAAASGSFFLAQIGLLSLERTLRRCKVELHAASDDPSEYGRGNPNAARRAVH